MAKKSGNFINILFTCMILLVLLFGLSSMAFAQDKEGELRIDYSDETGRVSFIGTGPGKSFHLQGEAMESIAAPDRPMMYLQHFGPMLGLQEPRQELSQQFSRDHEGRNTTRYQQMYQGVPIMGGELIVNLDERGGLLSINGETSPDLDLATTPEISAAAAREIAIGAVAKGYGLAASELSTTEPELWIYDQRLLRPSTRPAELVWRMDVTAADGLQPIRELVLVNAARGGISLHFNQVDTAWTGESRTGEGVSNAEAGAYASAPPRRGLAIPGGYRKTYTANNGTTLPGTLLCKESSDPCTGGTNPDADGAHAHAADAYDFYDSYHGRDSIDDGGMTIKSSVDYGDDTAFWNGSQMVFGDDYPLADDVVAHEYTHGVTQYTSGLFYYYQSGAINESFSDVWGEFVDLTNGTGSDDPGDRWYLGEDSDGAGTGAIRYMANPLEFEQPDRMTSEYYYTGTANLSYNEGDYGGVHKNNGVNNKAAYLLTDGDTFNGQDIEGLGMIKVAAIYYEVQTSLLTTAADYKDLSNALYQGCLNLVGGAEGITAGDCTEVQEATIAVEMDQEPVTGYNPEAGICDGVVEVPIYLFSDEIDSLGTNFAPGLILGTDQWYVSSWYATSGEYSLYGDDYCYGCGDYPWPVNDSYVYMTVDVPLAGGSQPFLHFNHAFGFEDWELMGEFYDGGWLEYSTDGGSNWYDAVAMFDDGLDYTGEIYTGFGNPNAGHVGFVGDSHGYVSTRYDLSSLAGGNVRFRWRTSIDPSFFDWGWWVDDVNIYTCESPELEYGGYTIDDDSVGSSSGDGDGLPECGETIELAVTLDNVSAVSATDVTATISSSDGYIVGAPYSSLSDYPDIGAGGNEENLTAYVIPLEASIPYGYSIPFTLDITAGNGGPWSDGFGLIVACGAPTIPNDDINDPTVISALPYSSSQSTSGATLAGDDPPIKCIDYEQGYNSVWYSYTPVSNGVITVDTFGSDYDTVLALWTGTRGALNRITANCDDDSEGTLQSEVRAGVAAGTQMYIEVVGKTVDDYGTLNLSLSQAANPTISARNGSFESDADGNGIPNAWNGKLLTASDERVCNQAVAGSCSFLMAGIGENKLLKQTELAGGDAGEEYSLSGWGRSTSANGAGPFAIRVVMKYLDGTKGVFRINFDGGTHGWQYSQMNFTTEKAYTRMLVSLMYGKAGGTVWFDDVRLDPVP